MPILRTDSWSDFTQGVAAAVNEGVDVKIITGPMANGGYAVEVSEADMPQAVEDDEE